MTHADATKGEGHPWTAQLTQTRPEPWTNGKGILTLSTVMCLWYAALIFRFTGGAATDAAQVWLGALVAWLVLQIWLARLHLPERFAAIFSTILQALIPTIATVGLVLAWPDLLAAVLAIAQRVSVIELVAIHILRLAAWGTVVKYREGQLPRYFFLFGSLPDLGFALLTVLLTAMLLLNQSSLPDTVAIAFSFMGIAAFLGAAATMYFGVPGTLFSWRWPRVDIGREAPTLLPFRWPMNLAPAFCGPVFWMAHGLLLLKVMSG